MAQGIKKFVARKMNQGNSVKKILSEVVKNEECNWYDTVRVFLWWLWFKCEPVVLSVLDFLKNIFAVLFWVVVLLIIGTVVAIVVTVVVVLTAPFWMPFRLWFAPEKVAKLLLDTAYGDINKLEEAPMEIWDNIWKTGGKVMNFFWAWAYNLLPMSRRQWFIKEDSKALSAYEPATQLAYYDEQVVADKVATLKAMSEEAMRLVWNRGELKDREYCLNVFDMKLEDYKLLFENEDKEQFNLLKVYCSNEENSVDGELQRYFVEQLVGERSDRAYEVLKVCVEVKSRPDTVINYTVKCKTPILEVRTLTDLIKMFSGENGDKACEILTSYWRRCTLSAEVVKVLIMAATESFVDDGKSRAYELVKKVVKRDGLSTDLAEFFFSRCDSVENDEMTKVINECMDCILINSECVSVDDKDQVKKLTDYFTIRKEVSVEGQKLLREWQYELYRKTGHKLDAEAISYLLVKRLKESDVSFFMQVLDEAGDELSEKDVKLMVLTPWKRDILIERFAKEERRKAIGVV